MNDQSTEEEIFVLLKPHIAEALSIDPAEIEMASRIFLDLGAESIDVLDIRFRIEQTFDLKVEDQESFVRELAEEMGTSQLQERLTVGGVVRYIRKQLRQQAAAS